MNRQSAITGLVATLFVLGSVAVALAEEPAGKSPPFTSVFPVDKANLVSVDRNHHAAHLTDRLTLVQVRNHTTQEIQIQGKAVQDFGNHAAVLLLAVYCLAGSHVATLDLRNVPTTQNPIATTAPNT